ncbi:hypothetical protein GGX14DRAFT_476436 [Mycena pura]|uniref:F-box domain-containing protein n=1 Tax=Mycena pura TaxID=153505 RepID=A0AAD6Y3A7_9AGAR|nr:hypothetical protein GGX14DRAFT_476436 [Mycena pura]
MAYIQLTGLAVLTLARLPILSEFTLRRCNIANGESIPSVSNAFRLCRFSSYSDRIEEWLPLLEPSSLRILHVRSAPTTGAVLPVFPYVHELQVRVNPTPTPADIDFLKKLPGVTKLRMDMDWSRGRPRLPLATLPANVLPVLADFTGPIRALQLFIARDTLTRIDILTRINADGETELDEFVTELQQLPAPLTNLIHLVATFSYSCIDTATGLEAIFASLPRLQDVEITFALYQADWFDPAPAVVVSKLPSIHGLSPHLQRLSLIWQCSYSLPPHTVDTIESDCDFFAVRAAVVAQCPDLKVLWLDGRDFVFLWHMQADIMDETEAMVTDPEDVEFVRFAWEVARQPPRLIYVDKDA